MFSWLLGKRNRTKERRGPERRNMDKLKAEVLEQVARLDPQDTETVKKVHEIIDEHATEMGIEFPVEEPIVSSDEETKVIERKS